MIQENITRDSYLLITVTWKGGFTHEVACRGYGLKSQLNFMKTIEYIDTCVYRECTEEFYNLKIYGDGSEWQQPLLVDTPPKKQKTSTKSLPKKVPLTTQVGKKPSLTKPSVKTVKSKAKPKVKSSPVTKKPSSGSLQKNGKPK